MAHCPFHQPEDPNCTQTIASQAHYFIEEAQSPREAGEIAVVAIREILKMAGAVKVMPGG